MSDIEINLYEQDRTDGPVATLSASYAGVSRMTTKEIVEKAKSSLKPHLIDGRMVLELEDAGNRAVRSIDFSESHPFGVSPVSNRRIQLENQLWALVNEWRSQ